MRALRENRALRPHSRARTLLQLDVEVAMSTTQRVYDGHGSLRLRDLGACGHEAPLVPRRAATIADSVPITTVMSPTLVCAYPDLPLVALIRLMVDQHIGCVPIVDHQGHPHGIVTKSDLVEQLVDDKPVAFRCAQDVMMPFALTLDERATVAHAASLMTLEDMHHVMVVSCTGALIGVVSTKDIVGWLVENDQLSGSRGG
jgi:CBS domain-containing protein